MHIKGWVRTSLIDYPRHIAAVLFTGGCSFRCPMCHNAHLVLEPAAAPDLDEGEVFTFLERRARVLDGVVVTGGEPTLDPGLARFLRRVRALGYEVKLDTNGYHPRVLAALLAEGLPDYVAMDVKAPPGKYALLTGLPQVEVERVEESVSLLREAGLPYELRTTLVPGLLDEEDVVALATWVRGAPRYALQGFRGLHTLHPALEGRAPYPRERLEALARRVAPYFDEVVVRGA